MLLRTCDLKVVDLSKSSLINWEDKLLGQKKEDRFYQKKNFN